MSKILILSASTGAGHNQAANNLKREFLRNAHSVEIVDLFESTSKTFNKLITDGYDILATKLPAAYGLIYHSTDKKELNDYLLKTVFFLIEKRVKKIIDTTNPDIVISTHPFGVPIVASIKKNQKDIIFMQVVTDFKAHYTYVDDEVDAYITASDYTRQTLIEKGISSNITYAYGIPTKDEFREETEKKFTPEGIFKILVMGGSMGLKAIEECVEVLCESNLKLKLTVVCAKNKSLQERLTKNFELQIKEGIVSVLGFVDNVHELMEESDLIVTKPGGLTTTEAISKCIPMVIPFAIPGQEQENTTFMTDENMAISVGDVKLLPKYISELIENPQKYLSMVKNMKKLSESYSIDKIIELSEKLIANANS